MLGAVHDDHPGKMKNKNSNVKKMNFLDLGINIRISLTSPQHQNSIMTKPKKTSIITSERIKLESSGWTDLIRF